LIIGLKSIQPDYEELFNDRTPEGIVSCIIIRRNEELKEEEQMKQMMYNFLTTPKDEMLYV
jgi:hypothetical protein